MDSVSPAVQLNGPPLPRTPLIGRQTQIDADKSLREMTTPANPYALRGSWAGRSSKAIWWLSPRSMV